jgi:predicted ATPase
LKLASCLGSTFDYRYIEIAWKKSSIELIGDDRETTCLEVLEDLSKVGFLIRGSSDQRLFSWVHDKIREAATNLIPESMQPMYKREIGETLLGELTAAELDSMIFVVVDLLNFSSFHDLSAHERHELAHLNLMASKKAIKLSSFESAAKYAGKGMELLDDGAWDKDDYMLPLQLYSSGATSEGFLGNLRVMEQYCKTVISKDRIPLNDKLEVYSTEGYGGLLSPCGGHGDDSRSFVKV